MTKDYVMLRLSKHDEQEDFINRIHPSSAVLTASKYSAFVGVFQQQWQQA